MLKNLISFDFSEHKRLFATNKFRRSLYPCTASGIPKPKALAQFVYPETFFSIPFKK